MKDHPADLRRRAASPGLSTRTCRSPICTRAASAPPKGPVGCLCGFTVPSSRGTEGLQDELRIRTSTRGLAGVRVIADRELSEILTDCNTSASTDPVIAFGRNAAARPKGDTISGSRYRIWGMTNGAVWVPLRLFSDTMYPAQSSLRSSVSRPSGNADINAPQSAPICPRPGALAPGIATSASRPRRRYASR